MDLYLNKHSITFFNIKYTKGQLIYKLRCYRKISKIMDEKLDQKIIPDEVNKLVSKIIIFFINSPLEKIDKKKVIFRTNHTI